MKINAWIIASAVLMAGCMPQAELGDLERFVAQVKARPGGQIEPVPTFENYQPFAYQAGAKRSPFVAPIEVRTVNRPESNPNLKPDDDRSKEYLESFSLDSLAMVGTVALGQRGTYA